MIPFKPVVEKMADPEDAFLPEHPEEAIKSGNIAAVPWITGLNSGDGALRVAAIYDDYKLVEDLNEKFDEIVPMSLFLQESSGDVTATARQIRRFYFGDTKIDNNTVFDVVNVSQPLSKFLAFPK